MATHVDIIGFHKDEFVEIQFFGKDRKGEVLPSAEGQTVTLVLSRTAGGNAVDGLKWSTGTGHITLTDEPNSEWKLAFSPDDFAEVSEGRYYFYNIWTQLNPGAPILQACGRFVLRPSISAT